MTQPKYITPEQYAALDAEGRYNYDPEYHSYKKHKERRYEECDRGFKHFLGWYEVTTGVGEPFRYVWVFKFVPYAMQGKIVDNLNNSNVFMKRMMQKGRW